jgi:hypothetical protein
MRSAWCNESDHGHRLLSRRWHHADLRVGNPSANQLKWDGTTLTIAANGSGLTIINGANNNSGVAFSAFNTGCNMNGLTTTGLRATDLSGSGNDYACVDPNGIFFRSNAAC